MAEKMLAVLKDKPEPGVSIKEVPIPKPKEGEVLVKIKRASICGTDIGIYDWNEWAASHITPPTIIGHEIVGEVVEINGDPQGLEIGDMVSSETHIFSGKSHQCKIGNPHLCEDMELFGIGRDGGFADYATVPIKTAWKNDPSIPLDAMSVQEPLGNAVHVVMKSDVRAKTVLILGLGPTGLCAAAAAQALGALKVIGIDLSEYRRNLGTDMGCDEVYDKVPAEYNGKCEVVLEMSGNKHAIQDGLDAVRIAGVFMAFGIPKEEVSIDFGKYLINKELTILSVFGRKIWETWVQTTDLLTSGKIDLEKIITHRFKLSDFEKAMEVMKSGNAGKVVLVPDSEWTN